MEALHYLESLKCPCGCGNYRDESMTVQAWDVNSVRCIAGMALDQAKRRLDVEYKDDPARHDGRLWYADPVPPDPS
jgi:hypothetical protein